MRKKKQYYIKLSPGGATFFIFKLPFGSFQHFKESLATELLPACFCVQSFKVAVIYRSLSSCCASAPRNQML